MAKELTPEVLLRVKELRDKIDKARDDYYNKKIESMSNYEYDKLWDELEELETEYDLDVRDTDNVGAEVDEDNGLPKVTHTHEAKSLGKTKSIDELIKEQSKTSKGKDAEVCLSWKLDGSTLCLTYDKGQLQLASTRGNGIVGSDITANTKYDTIQGLPQTINYKGKLEVRGECLMSYAEFNRLNDNGQYANARNLANSTITMLDTDTFKQRQLLFKAFQLVDSDEKINKFSNGLEFLKNEGFGVVPYVKVKVSELQEKIEEWSNPDVIQALGVPVDGLVVAMDDLDEVKDLSDTGHHPNKTKSMAFKWQDECAETVLRKIEWSPSRTGLVNPVAIFDPVELCGTTVSRASLFNISYIKNLNLQEGDRVTVYKANMIIPQIAENLDKDKSKNLNFDINCPCCQQKLIIKKSKDNVETLFCENQKCLAKELGRFAHFVEKDGLNIEGLAENSLRILMEKGVIKELADIFRLSEKDREAYTSIEGLGDKSFDNLLKNIEKARYTDTEHFLYACGIPSIGRGQIKEIVNYIRENFDELKIYHKDDDKCEGQAVYNTLLSMAINNYDFTKINGIGNILANNLQQFFEDEIIFPMEEELKNSNTIYDCCPYIELTDPLYEKQQTKGDSMIAGKTFVITGDLNHFKNRDEMIDKIESLGGKCSGSVSKKTDYLINNDINSTSSKNQKAKSLNVPIISEDDFLAMIDKDKSNDTPSVEEKEEIEEDDLDEMLEFM